MPRQRTGKTRQETVGMPGATFDRLDKLRKEEDGEKESWAKFFYRMLPKLEGEKK
jgi:hypothetical protein